MVPIRDISFKKNIQPDLSTHITPMLLLSAGPDVFQECDIFFSIVWLFIVIFLLNFSFFFFSLPCLLYSLLGLHPDCKIMAKKEVMRYKRKLQNVRKWVFRFGFSSILGI